MYLLDTNIVSEGRRGSIEVISWFTQIDPNDLYLSVISIGEIAHGIALRERKDAKAAEILLLWLNNLRHDMQDRILPVSENCALEWGKIALLRTRNMADGLIAATAIAHGLKMVTRNVRDFEDCGIKLINPWQL